MGLSGGAVAPAVASALAVQSKPQIYYLRQRARKRASSQRREGREAGAAWSEKVEDLAPEPEAVSPERELGTSR